MTKLFFAVFVEKNQNEATQQKFDAQKRYLKPIGAIALAVSACIVPIFGLLAHGTMDKLADLAQGFLGIHHGGHAVHYFAWVNLKGGLTSIAIGAVLYLTVVRRWMMADGRYVNRWPEWLDLEDRIYRPLLEKILPGIFGWICNILDKGPELLLLCLPKIGAAIAGILNILVDGTVVLLRKTLFRDTPERGELEEGNALTHVIGVSLNLLEELLNRTIWRHHEHRKDLEHWFVLRYAAFKENATLVGRSLSFGLVLFGLGLCATLVYLLLSALR